MNQQLQQVVKHFYLSQSEAEQKHLKKGSCSFVRFSALDFILTWLGMTWERMYVYL